MIIAPLSSLLPSTIARTEAGEAPTTLVVKAAEHRIEYAELREDTGQVVWRWPHGDQVKPIGGLLDVVA